MFDGWASSVRSRLKHLLRSRLPRKVLFTHVSKTGGTSVDRAFRRTYRIPVTSPDYEALRSACIDVYGDGSFEATEDPVRILCLYAIKKKCPYISGHFPVEDTTIETAKREGYVLITLLRDPVDRFVSTFVYHHVRMWELGIDDPPPLGKTEEVYRERLNDVLGEEENKFTRPAYRAMFGGGTPDDVIEQISSYDVVGITSEMKSIETKLQRLGFSVTIGHENRTSARSQYPERTSEIRGLFSEPDVRERVRDCVAFDRQVVNHFLN